MPRHKEPFGRARIATYLAALLTVVWPVYHGELDLLADHAGVGHAERN